MKTVVALSAWKGSGKDMVADYLVQNHGFERISFADPLKDRVAEQYGLDRASLDDQSQKELPLLDMPCIFTDAFSQHVGMFMYREFRTADGKVAIAVDIDKDGHLNSVTYTNSNGDITRCKEKLYWTRRALCILEGSSKRTSDKDHWIKQAVAKMKDGGKYVIADVRYQSEMASLNKAAPGSVIPMRIQRFETTSSQDPSERDLDHYYFEHLINNQNGITKEGVFAQVESVLISKGVLSEQEEDDIQASDQEA